METTTEELAAIRNCLSKIPEPFHTVTDKYNGMHFTEFIKAFRNLKISYPYKDNKKIFLIELYENNCVTTFEMTDNICTNTYIFENDNAKCHTP